MIQLAYHPAFDAGHALFRFMRLREGLRLSELEFDKLRILDFYLLFPFRAEAIRFKQADMKLRALARQEQQRAGYASLPSDVALFGRMEAAQVAAAQTLAAKGAFAGEELRRGIARFEPFGLPDDLQTRVRTENTKDASIFAILSPLATYPLLGRDGLKDRTGLIEYRYDKV